MIADRTVEYVTELQKRQSWLSEADSHRIVGVIVAGVLKRLEQIAIGGGQIGNA